jgi:site-specific recombinase XerD
VFGKNGYPGPVNVGENFFRKRFKKVKKQMGFSNKHTLYGFRHTSVCQLIRSGQIWNDIMKLTGHTQYSSFQKYASSLDSESPKDLSHGFAVKI